MCGRRNGAYLRAGARSAPWDAVVLVSVIQRRPAARFVPHARDARLVAERQRPETAGARQLGRPEPRRAPPLGAVGRRVRAQLGARRLDLGAPRAIDHDARRRRIVGHEIGNRRRLRVQQRLDVHDQSATDRWMPDERYERERLVERVPHRARRRLEREERRRRAVEVDERRRRILGPRQRPDAARRGRVLRFAESLELDRRFGLGREARHVGGQHDGMHGRMRKRAVDVGEEETHEIATERLVVAHRKLIHFYGDVDEHRRRALERRAARGLGRRVRGRFRGFGVFLDVVETVGEMDSQHLGHDLAL